MATFLGFGISVLEILFVLNSIVFLYTISNFENRKSNKKEKSEILECKKNIHEAKQKINLILKISSESLKFNRISH